jgi:hypothetical protein
LKRHLRRPQCSLRAIPLSVCVIAASLKLLRGVQLFVTAHNLRHSSGPR